MIYGKGDQTRDFVFVKDVVSANLAALDSGNAGAFNIGSGKSVSVIQLFDTLRSMVGIECEPLFGDARDGDISHSLFNIAKAKQVLDWRPEWSLDAGLQETLQFYQQI